MQEGKKKGSSRTIMLYKDWETKEKHKAERLRESLEAVKKAACPTLTTKTHQIARSLASPNDRLYAPRARPSSADPTVTSFKPHIDPQSRIIAAQKRSKGESVADRLLKSYEAKKKRQQERREEEQRRREEAELELCTFSPSTEKSQKSFEATGGKLHKENILDRTKRYHATKNQRLQDKLVTRHSDEMKECTFHPETKASSSSTPTSSKRTSAVPTAQPPGIHAYLLRQETKQKTSSVKKNIPRYNAVAVTPSPAVLTRRLSMEIPNLPDPASIASQALNTPGSARELYFQAVARALANCPP